MAKPADSLYHQRRGADLLAGVLDPGRLGGRGAGPARRQPNISSLSRGRGKLGPDPVRTRCSSRWRGRRARTGHRVFFCCGLRVVSMDGSTRTCRTAARTSRFSGAPSNQSRDGAFPQVRWVAAAESGTGSLLGAGHRPVPDSRSSRWPWTSCTASARGCWCSRTGQFLSWSLARAFLATGAHILWRASASFALKPVKACPTARTWRN